MVDIPSIQGAILGLKTAADLAKGFLHLQKETEPPHWICPHCYEDGRKSIVHDAEKHDTRRRHIIKCPRCSFENEKAGPDERNYVQG